ncbi:MAG TPA: tetratricopeptide repeat protein, partial [bacterium]|nr:tetratricopeptide repeat protein [bacterium]
LQSGDTDTAVRTFKDIISRRPNHIMSQKSRLELAEEALKQKNFDEAVRLAEAVIENVVDDNAARAQYIIGNRWFISGDYQKAQDELMRVTILYKNYEEWVAHARLLIAQCQNNLGNIEDAEKTLRDVMEMHPRDEFGQQAKKLLNEIR